MLIDEYKGPQTYKIPKTAFGMSIEIKPKYKLFENDDDLKIL